ncbi:MAG: RDD family protein [Candidatus Electrothrix sp. AU1_5]|nr:RDD family protein [Candidatus Electrothrix gigas]
MISKRYSTSCRRIFAAIIDSYIVSKFSENILLYGYEYLNNSDNFIETLIFLVYSVLFHTIEGRTIGKYICKVQVVDCKTEKKITFKQAFLRDIVFVIFLLSFESFYICATFGQQEYNQQWLFYIFILLNFSLLLWPLIEIITMFFNSKRRALHDFIAGTVVIRTDITIEQAPVEEIENKRKESKLTDLDKSNRFSHLSPQEIYESGFCPECLEEKNKEGGRCLKCQTNLFDYAQVAYKSKK